MSTLSAYDVATELGRSKDWLYAHWRDLVGTDGMPAPINGGGTRSNSGSATKRGGELTWSAVQFYVWLDRDLPKTLRDQAAAVRAAIETMKASPTGTKEAQIIDDWKTKLDERYGT